jgi:hypothetical protein
VLNQNEEDDDKNLKRFFGQLTVLLSSWPAIEEHGFRKCGFLSENLSIFCSVGGG